MYLLQWIYILLGDSMPNILQFVSPIFQILFEIYA